MQREAEASQKSPALVSRVAGHLLHPSLVRMPRDPRYANPSTLQVNKEQDIVGHQAAPREDFDREEIDTGH